VLPLAMGYSDDLVAVRWNQFMLQYYLYARDIAEFTEMTIHRCFPPSRMKSARRTQSKPQILEAGISLHGGEINLTDRI